MEDLLCFVSIVIIVFGILQIILFFKVWGMTNKVTSIENKLKNQKHSYEFYMISGEKEKAFQVIRTALVNRLTDLRLDTYGNEKFIVLANEVIPSYIKRMKVTGFDIPNHLLSAEAFMEYQDKINSL